MHVFISDIHFGRSDDETERSVERDLISFLRTVRPEVDNLFLVGDVFEHYIEYRHSIPKGFSRFLGLLGEWTDAGIPVHYYLGNHDPWHRDYFERELGVRMVTHDSIELLDGLRVYITHGDGLGRGARPYRWLKPVLRHPLPVGAFTGILPSDLGLSIARWYSRTFQKTTMNGERVAALREVARQLLVAKSVDIVVMGHSHHPELTVWEEGTYVNPGGWYLDRTAAVIEDGKTSLLRWNGEAAESYSPN